MEQNCTKHLFLWGKDHQIWCTRTLKIIRKNEACDFNKNFAKECEHMLAQIYSAFHTCFKCFHTELPTEHVKPEIQTVTIY